MIVSTVCSVNIIKIYKHWWGGYKNLSTSKNDLQSANQGRLSICWD